jgi:hypothetical protein
MAYEKQINARLAPFGLTTADLTPDELHRAQEEQRNRKKGYIVLDGVLTSSDILSRALKKQG